MTTCNINEIHIQRVNWDDYELMDFGDRQKLERFGDYVIIRDEPRAWVAKKLPQSQWEKAVARHRDDQRNWHFRKKVTPEWLLTFEDLTIQARFPAKSKQIGVFPEHASQWRWIRDQVAGSDLEPVRLLNLFGYTGIASLVAAKAGAFVTHVEASRGIVQWAKLNQQLSDVPKDRIRWIVDDVTKFCRREVRRGRKYDAIILDPPAFGRGPKKEIWQVDQHLILLLEICKDLISEHPLFIIINLYSIDQSSVLIGNLLSEMMAEHEGIIRIGELVLDQKHPDRMLPLSLFGTWERVQN